MKNLKQNLKKVALGVMFSSSIVLASCSSTDSFQKEPVHCRFLDVQDKLSMWKNNIKTDDPKIQHSLSQALDFVSMTTVGQNLFSDINKNVKISVAHFEKEDKASVFVSGNDFEIVFSDELFSAKQDKLLPLFLIEEMQLIRMYKYKYQDYGMVRYDKSTKENMDKIEYAYNKALKLDALMELKELYPHIFRGSFESLRISNNAITDYQDGYQRSFHYLKEQGVPEEKLEESAHIRNFSNTVVRILKRWDYRPFDMPWYVGPDDYETEAFLAAVTKRTAPYLTIQHLRGFDNGKLVRVNQRSR